MMDDVTAVKEEIKGWKMASDDEAEAGRSIEQEFLTHKMDDNAESIIVEDFENRPSKKAKCSESGVLEPAPTSPTISALSPISECYESIVPESDNQIDCDPLASPPSPTNSTLPPVFELMKEGKVPLDDEKQPEKHHETYDYLPQDYALTDRDVCAHIVIETSLEKELLVKIDEICVKQHQLMCLLNEKGWLNDDVISAYICCIKDQVHLQNESKVYFENPFVTALLKRDGNLGIQENGTFMTEIVKNYVKHDMIELPINMNNTHWYLAVLNAKKCEIQVLDSLCCEFDRDDLTITLRGLQYHLDILKSQNLISNNWKDFDVTKWKITEQLREPIQKDSSSCGLFMLKFMEYWTGDTLSHPITQEIITSFRYKLASILLCWKTNMVPMAKMVEQSDDDIKGDPNDVVMLDSPDEKNNSTELSSLSVENKYQSLISVLSNMSLHELVFGLCSYIKSINSTETLEKVWVQISKPYPISLTLKKLQGILNEDLPMNRDCFNLVVRRNMFDNIQTVKKRRGLISKHYLDMLFWMITDFGRHPNYRKKLDVEQLANSIRSWPGIKYSVSACKSIHIPVQSNGDFILFILDRDTKTVNILDPTPVDPIYQYNPHARYVQKILWIAEYLPKAMSKACPGSNIFLWRQKILHDIPVQNRELSGYLVTLFMSAWEDEKLHLPVLKDGYELRKQILGQLLTFKENECENNMPAGVLEFINCIRKIKK